LSTFRISTALADAELKEVMVNKKRYRSVSIKKRSRFETDLLRTETTLRTNRFGLLDHFASMGKRWRAPDTAQSSAMR
jgi:hypothetical protein